MESKKTLVLGASDNSARYAHMATLLLRKHQHEVVAVGNRKGKVGDVDIQTNMPNKIDELDTITLYLSAQNQTAYYPDIIRLKPERVIFNPGTENPSLTALLDENQIPHEHACTLVMLHAGLY